MSITTYMHRQAFGDYSRAGYETREEMEALALDYAAHEQARPTIFKAIGAQQARHRYDTDRATAHDLDTLQALGIITAQQADAYRIRHQWTPRKYGRR